MRKSVSATVGFLQITPAENLRHRKIGHEDDGFHDAKRHGDEQPNEFAPQPRNAVRNNARAMTEFAPFERRGVRRVNGGHARGIALAVPRTVEDVLMLCVSY